MSIKQLGFNKKYYLRTYGCQANERDSETIRGILELMSYTEVKEPESSRHYYYEYLRNP
jgi:tRNA-2-methylthio-N6-dimethylallyladenosine synthase